VVQNSIGVDRDSQPIWSDRIGYGLFPAVLDRSVNLTGEQRSVVGVASQAHLLKSSAHVGVQLWGGVRCL
jgi:hypothetical protein